MIRILDPARIFCTIAILALSMIGANWSHAVDFGHHTHHELAGSHDSTTDDHDHVEETEIAETSSTSIHCGSDNVFLSSIIIEGNLSISVTSGSIVPIRLVSNLGSVDPPPPRKFPV